MFPELLLAAGAEGTKFLRTLFGHGAKEEGAEAWVLSAGSAQRGEGKLGLALYTSVRSHNETALPSTDPTLPRTNEY